MIGQDIRRCIKSSSELGGSCTNNRRNRLGSISTAAGLLIRGIVSGTDIYFNLRVL